MKRRIISTVLVVLLLLTALSSISCFATESPVDDDCPTVQELLSLTELAWEYRVFLGSGIEWYWRIYNGEPDESYDFIEWLASKGFMPQTLEIKDGKELPLPADRHTGELFEDYYQYSKNYSFYALPEGITLEMLKEEYYKLFYYDIHRFFDCAGDHPVYGQPGGWKCYYNRIKVDDSGRVYMHGDEIESDGSEWEFFENEDVWKSAKITFKDSKKIILTVRCKPYFNAISIEYRNTPDGWRVYNRVYDVDLPKTGDNTPIFVALIALPTLGLGMLAVKTWKKRKKRI